MIDGIPYMRGALVAEYAIGGHVPNTLDPAGFYPVVGVLSEAYERGGVPCLRAQIMQGSRVIYCRLPVVVYDSLPRGQYLTE